MYQSLSVKYRPRTFQEVCGQSIVVKILEKTLETKAYKNAYLFAGDSGCGKTTLARIFAKAINGGEGDPIEIDAASNNGVEDVRAIVEQANQRSLFGEYKIYIIDECHAISTQGWQAFLKCIEEAPKYTIFMFCTTEPNKVPATILNRVIRFNISKVAVELVKARLLYICQQEGYTNYEAACDLISKTADGCMRDAITNLDRCVSFSTDLSVSNVKQVLANLSYEAMFRLTWALQEKNEGDMLAVLSDLSNNSTNLKTFIETYLNFVINLLKYNQYNNINLTNIPAYLATADNPVVQQTVSIQNCKDWLNKLIDLLLTIKMNIKFDNAYRNTIEAYFIRFCMSE